MFASENCTKTIYVYIWSYENQVALSKGLWVTFGTGFSKVHTIKTKDCC